MKFIKKFLRIQKALLKLVPSIEKRLDTFRRLVEILKRDPKIYLIIFSGLAVMAAVAVFV